jgi:hypothetical protein
MGSPSLVAAIAGTSKQHLYVLTNQQQVQQGWTQNTSLVLNSHGFGSAGMLAESSCFALQV